MVSLIVNTWGGPVYTNFFAYDINSDYMAPLPYFQAGYYPSGGLQLVTYNGSIYLIANVVGMYGGLLVYSYAPGIF